jgi:MYXO-CTERM domain-containing protein
MPSGCGTDSDCAATERCNTSTRDCEPRPTDRGDLGDACTSPDECNSGVCAAAPTGGICSQSCNWLEPTSCPSGYYCDGDATGTCGEGLCLAGTAGATPLGAPCTADTECATLMCSLGTCAQPCIPGGTTACPDGYACQVGTTPGCGACKVARSTGEACEMNEDCASRICAVRGDGAFCTQFCTDATTCPPDFTCEAAGERSVCAPPAGGIITPDAGTTGGGRARDDGCCSVAPGATSGPARAWAVVLLVLGAAVWRRRR